VLTTPWRALFRVLKALFRVFIVDHLPSWLGRIYWARRLSHQEFEVGPSQFRRIFILTNIADLETDAGRPESAAKHIAEAQLVPLDDPEILVRYTACELVQYSKTLLKLHRDAEARSLLTRAVQSGSEANHPPERALTRWCREEAARLLQGLP
jgi:hypothetical protein